MSRIAYVNGNYGAHNQAAIHIEDRGFQFADGVYEVWAVRDGVLQDHALHMKRLLRSLGELDMPMRLTERALDVILNEVVRRNRVQEGMVYLQITRGVAPRDHAWDTAIQPSIVVTAKSVDPAIGHKKAESGVEIRTTADIRWRRCDIKSVSLLPNVLAKQQAREQGAYEAWFVDEEGFVTEGSSTNAWIVTKERVLITRALSSDILGGVTRLTLLGIAEQHQLKFEERSFTITEAQNAAEAFISAATTLAMPVVAIDGIQIGDGRPGTVTTSLRQAYLDHGTMRTD